MGFWDTVASAGPYANNLTSFRTNNHINNSSFNFSTGRMLFLMPNQQCQSTEGNRVHTLQQQQQQRPFNGL